MQAIWRGAINFGLISIPVRLFSATEEKSIRFNLLHVEDDGRVGNNRTCKVCGKEGLTKDDLVRAFEYEKGSYVKFSDEEIANVEVETSHTVEVVHFTPAVQIDPIYYARSYYLAPEDLGVKAYGLLRKALMDSDRVAIVKVAIRDKERLGTLRVRGNTLVLETMYWPDEIREARFPELDGEIDVRDQEFKMAQTLIESLTEDFDPKQFRDTYRDALMAAVQQKIEGKQIVAPAASEDETEVLDLSEALKRSLEAVKTREEERAQASGQ